MELIATRRQLSGLPENRTYHLGRVRVSSGTYELRNLGAVGWAKTAFRQADQDHIAVYVHGYNTSHAEMLARFQLIRRGCRRAGFEGEVVSFEWPSLDRLSAYHDDKKLARAAAPFLIRDCVDVLRAHKPGAKISFIAHSMGSLLLAEALVQNPVAAGSLSEILFVASDVAQVDTQVGEAYADALSKAGRRLTNYRSMRDQVLDLSQQLFNGGKARAGRQGLHPAKHEDAVNVSCSVRFFTLVEPRDRTTTKTHNFYFDDPRFYQDVALTLAGRDAGNMPTRSRRPHGELQIKP